MENTRTIKLKIKSNQIHSIHINFIPEPHSIVKIENGTVWIEENVEFKKQRFPFQMYKIKSKFKIILNSLLERNRRRKKIT